MNDRVRPWWREPIMWLVVGAPVTVVVAGVVTTLIALQGADPVLKAESAKPPALQARNHAATPRDSLPVAQP